MTKLKLVYEIENFLKTIMVDTVSVEEFESFEVKVKGYLIVKETIRYIYILQVKKIIIIKNCNGI